MCLCAVGDVVRVKSGPAELEIRGGCTARASAMYTQSRTRHSYHHYVNERG